MTAIEKLKTIINNENVGKCIFNLYDRWRDESMYEDIRLYGKMIADTINEEFPQYGIKLVSSTRRPFGVKIMVDDRKFHISAKLQREYVVISVNEC